MKWFLMIYDRDAQQVIYLQAFKDMPDLVEFHRMFANHDVVLFQAKSEDSLRATHGSYFFSPAELLRRAKEVACQILP